MHDYIKGQSAMLFNSEADDTMFVEVHYPVLVKASVKIQLAWEEECSEISVW